MGDSLTWCMFSLPWVSCCPYNLLLTFLFLFFFLVVSTRLKLKSRYQGRVQATLDFALTIDDFDKLVDSLSLYDHILGPEPSAYVLRLILREERSKYLSLILSLFFPCLYICLICLLSFHVLE